MILLALLVASCIVGPVSPVTSGAIAYPSSQVTLSSGTRAVFEVSPDFGAAGVVLVVAAGSSSDPRGKEGVAHLVEHLVFHSRHDHQLSYRRRLQALGAGSWNAMTNWDSTTYFAFGPTHSLPDLAALVAGVADDPMADVDEATFEHERAVVLDELRSRAEDGTPGQIMGFLDHAAFPEGHPYSRPVIGTEASIAGLTLADAVAFAKANYRPSRTVLALSGPLSLAEQEVIARGIADKYHWPQATPEPHSTASPAIADEPAPRSLEFETHELPVSVPSLWIGWSIPPATSPDAEAASLAAEMVGGTFAEHVYDHDWDVAYVNAMVSPGALSSMFYVRATLKEGSHPQATASSVVSTMLHGLSERTYIATPFAYYKQFLAARLLDAEQSLISRTLRVAESVDLTGAPIFLRTSIDRTASLPADRMAEFYHQYLTAERAHAVYVSPMAGKTLERVEIPHRADTAIDMGPAAIPSEVRDWMRAPNVGAAQRTTFPNGMQAIVLPRPGSAFHSLIVAYHGGVGMERQPGAAVASLWAKERIGSGDWGIVYQDRVSTDSTYESMSAVGADLPRTLHRLEGGTAFRIFWPPTQISNRLDVYEKQELAPIGVFQRTLQERFFGGHAYGAWTTAAKLRKVVPNDVYTYLNAIRRPRNGIVVAVGDVDPEQAMQLLASAFGQSEGGEAENPVATPPALETIDLRAGAHIFVVNRPGSDVARMAFRCALPAVGSADWGKTEVFAHAVGGDLLSDLRERTATSYSVSDDVFFLRGGTAYLEFGADLDYGHLSNAMATLRRVLEGAPANMINDRGLRVARASAAAQFNLEYGTPGQLANAIVGVWNRDWPIATIDAFPEQVENTRVEDLTRLLDHCQRNWVLGVLGEEANIRAAIGAWNP